MGDDISIRCEFRARDERGGESRDIRDLTVSVPSGDSSEEVVTRVLAPLFEQFPERDVTCDGFSMRTGPHAGVNRAMAHDMAVSLTQSHAATYYQRAVQFGLGARLSLSQSPDRLAITHQGLSVGVDIPAYVFRGGVLSGSVLMMGVRFTGGEAALFDVRVASDTLTENPDVSIASIVPTGLEGQVAATAGVMMAPLADQRLSAYLGLGVFTGYSAGPQVTVISPREPAPRTLGERFTYGVELSARSCVLPNSPIDFCLEAAWTLANTGLGWGSTLSAVVRAD